MRYWFDTEFIEDGKTIDLVSIGIVAENGCTYYAESSEFDASKAVPWVVDNVLSHLGAESERKTRAQIRDEVKAFIGDDEKPEIWAYYGAYDWVALCQLFGTMMDLPKNWPMFVRDLQQIAAEWGDPLPKQKTKQHNALNDALWTRVAYAEMRRLIDFHTPKENPYAKQYAAIFPLNEHTGITPFEKVKK